MTRSSQETVSGLVSTIIPVYNRPVLLREAVESVLSQTYPLIEVIIVDDGSTDDTSAVCDQLAAEHPVVKVVHQRHIACPGLSREAGRSIARGEYIQYLDSDDVLLPRKFEVMTKALAENPDCDVAYCYTRRYIRGGAIDNTPCERTGETFHKMLPEFLSQRFWHTCTPLYTRRVCDRVGPWSALKFWEDFEYDIRVAALNVRIVHCKEFLADFRDHGYQRLSGADFFVDPESVRHAPSAYRTIWEHARSYGLSPDDPNMQVFLRELQWTARRCRDLGLNAEAGEMLEIVNDVSGIKQNNNVLEDNADLPSISLTPVLTTETLYTVDVLGGIPVAQKKEPLVVTKNKDFLVVGGWAIDAAVNDAAGGVSINIDGKVHRAEYGSDRKDVANHFQNSKYRYSGFESLIPDLTPGMHSLSVNILTKNRTAYYKPGATLTFELQCEDERKNSEIDKKTGLLESSLAQPDLHMKWASEYLSDKNNKFFELAFDYIADVLKAPPGALILDAGCGPCHHAIRLANRGFSVEAVDFSDAVLKMAKANVAARGVEGLVNVRREDIRAFSFGSGHFDYILCWGVLMHVKDIEKALAELNRVLRNGGMLVIGENNMHSVQSTIYRWRSTGEFTAAGVEYWGDSSAGPILYRDLNVDWLIKWFRNNGFVIRKRVARQFTEAYVDVSSAFLKALIHAFNNAWFKYVKVPQPAFGNLIIVEKVG